MSAAPVRRENPGAGETMTFLSEPGERMQRFALELAPVSYGPPAHVHPTASERFTVIEGTLTLRLGRDRRDLEAGSSMLVPPGAVHTYANRSGGPVVVEVELDPGTEMRGFFDALYTLAEAGELSPTGGLSMRQAARLFRRFPDAMSIAGPPRAMQDGLWWMLTRFDRVSG